MSSISTLGPAALQFGVRCMGVGLGAGVGGLAGAEGSVLPGMTLGFAGMLMGMVGTADMDGDGVLMGRGRGACEALARPWRELKKWLLCDWEGMRVREGCCSSLGEV